MINEKIKNFIENYICDTKLKSAIMLNGPWGSGKSYYITNTLMPYLKEQCEYDVVKVSVYGLKDISELTKQIYYEVRIGKLKKKNEVLSSGKIIIKGILSGIASFFNVDPKISNNDLEKLYSSINLKNKLIIIEDLERTDIDIVKLLGFINNLTELDDAKVLLVANENEITKPKVVLNQKTNKFEQTYSEKAEEYLRVKEKTVSDTILFNLDFNEAIDSIVEMFKSEHLTKLFADKSFKEKVYKIIKSSQHENLRTVIFTLQKSIDIFKFIKPEDMDETISKKIVLTLFDICISLKKGNLEKTDLDIISKIDKEYKNTSSYFICEYILYQKIDTNSVNAGIEDLKNEEKLLSKNAYDEDIQAIQCYAHLDDKELLDSVNSIILKLENNSLSFYNYGTLASYIIFLSSFLDFDLEKIKRLMIKNIKTCKNPEEARYWFSGGVQQLTEGKVNEYIALKQEILNELNSKNKFNMEAEINKTIKTSKEFSDFCYSNKDKFINEHKFFGYIDVDNFVSVIEESKPDDITNYRYTFSDIYGFSNIYEFYKDDIPNLIKCIDKLKSLNKMDFSKTKTLVFDWLVEDLEKYAARLGFTKEIPIKE